MTNYVYIATSVDGFIARSNGHLDWLTHIENPNNLDFGYATFMQKIDAVVMGRNTFESVEHITPWPYTKPVFVLSRTRGQSIQKNRVHFVNMSPDDLVKDLNTQGYKNLYVDGGITICSFLEKNLIDELTITRVPILLGAGIPLFRENIFEIKLKHFDTITFENGLVQSTYQKDSPA